MKLRVNYSPTTSNIAIVMAVVGFVSQFVTGQEVGPPPAYVPPQTTVAREPVATVTNVLPITTPATAIPLRPAQIRLGQVPPRRPATDANTVDSITTDSASPLFPPPALPDQQTTSLAPPIDWTISTHPAPARNPFQPNRSIDSPKPSQFERLAQVPAPTFQAPTATEPMVPETLPAPPPPTLEEHSTLDQWSPDELHDAGDSPFSPDPDYSCLPYSAQNELSIYYDRRCIPTQRPLIEFWRPLYAPGELPPGIPLLGEKNLVLPHFLLFGDFRTGYAFNDNGAAGEKHVWASRLNLEFDFKITATERIHAFWGPIDEDGRFTRVEESDGDIELIEEFDDDFDILFFEGDVGYIWGGMTDQYAPFDLPFVAGKYPLLFQNGIWVFDALEGFAFTIPAKNSPFFDWSNYDLTFFFAFDDVDSPAFGTNDNLANMYGFNWFLEAYQGYWEIGYAFLEDTTGQGLSYSNVGLSYTRRYWNRISNSVRVIVNAGQSPKSGEKTADGTLLLIENALISRDPVHFVPYLNMFAGFGRPQSAARAAGAGGVLLNTGINFETDALTGFPTLDATANDTFGGAVGINWLGPCFSWQLITEFAMVQTIGSDPNRNAQNDQYGFGMRFQLPITNAWILRLDSMYGLIENEPDVRGARMELRWKF